MLTKAPQYRSTVRVVEDSSNVFHAGGKIHRKSTEEARLVPSLVEDDPRMVAHACVCGDNLSRV